MPRLALRSVLAAIVLALGLGACDDPAEPVTVASISVGGGNAQTGAAGTLLPTGLSVSVTGSDGQPFAGATVTWSVPAGGGSVNPATSQTDAQGRATTQWTLGTAPGAQTATAAVTGLAPATFSATAIVGAAATVTVTPATPTIDALQGTVTLAAQARDAFGNVVAAPVFAWASADPTTVTVNPTTGVATGVKVGTANVTATTAGRVGTIAVQVRQVATAITVGPANARVSQGSTVQLTATARDANGNAIPGLALTWASATGSVATVNSTGLVTGVSGGTSNITATSGTVVGTLGVTVVTNLTPTQNQTITGTMNVGRLTIPAGVTVTATSDVVINALEPVTIAGVLTGNCVNITINGSSSATYTGTIRNSCAAEPAGAEPGIVLANDGPLSITGATFEYDGSLEIKNDPAIVPASITGAPAPSILALGMTQSGACTVSGGVFVPKRPRARNGVPGTSTGGNGGNGASGGGVRLLCDGDLTLSGGTEVTAREGGNGGSGVYSTPSTDNASGRAGDGGNGGDMDVRATGNLTLSAARFNLANGGIGGDMTVLGRDPGGNATATAGNGGNGGAMRVVATGSITITGPGGLIIGVGNGGKGGEAIANAGNGLNAGASAATPGGSSVANGGNGGHSTDGRLQGSGAVAGLGFITTTGGFGGAGGAATAVAGKGGDGNVAFPNAAAGGNIEGHGGDGGLARAKNITGVTIGTSGNGGNMTISNGRGGLGANRCTAPVNTGGAGGKGGNGSGDAGTKGAGDKPGVDGTITVSAATGNGGNGNNGTVGGARGDAGTDGVAAGFARVNAGPNFVNGVAGVVCPPVQQQRRANIRLSTLPNSNGVVAPGTHSLALVDPTSNAVVGGMSIGAVGPSGFHFVGSNPDRIGLQAGNGTSWRFNTNGATLTGGTSVVPLEMTVCFTGGFGVNGGNPILVQQFNAAGTVISTRTVASTVRLDGQLASAGFQDNCQTIPAVDGVSFFGFTALEYAIMDAYGLGFLFGFVPL